MTQSFSDLGLSRKALAAIDQLGYTEPTAVQEQAIPEVLAQHDVIAAAKTGTGKTAAFCLPCFDRLGQPKSKSNPRMLVVTPTRELALQIETVCKTIARHTRHRVVSVVGGLSYNPQIDALARGCDVLIATPGRLIDLMQQESAHLDQVEILVLDEADRMLDMGFLPDMKRIVEKCPEKRQTLLFSATIDAAIERNMLNLLHDPTFVEVAHKGDVADTIDQYHIPVDHRQKQHVLVSLLEEKGGTRIIVFARTKHRVDTCVRRLNQSGFSAKPIHSGRSQNQRAHAIEDFTRGKCDILVATDVLARGIDISEVNYVVNFDLPDAEEDYIHRVGRTGRAGVQGFAVSFVTPEQTTLLKSLEKLINKDIPLLELTGKKLETNEQALAARATRKNARQDPELAQVARELKTKKKRSRKRVGSGKPQRSQPPARETHTKQHNQPEASTSAIQDENPSTERKHRSKTTKKHARKQQRRSVSSHKPADMDRRTSDSRQNRSHAKNRHSEKDMRPGRAQRASQTYQKSSVHSR